MSAQIFRISRVLLNMTSASEIIDHLELSLKSIRVTAPGKVLITGGYVVLEQPNTGLVVATTARFHSTIQWKLDVEMSNHPGYIKIEVLSEQFGYTLAYYVSLDAGDKDLRLLPCSSNVASNEYVSRTIEIALVAIRAEANLSDIYRKATARGLKLFIKLQASNDFYSQTKQLQERQLQVTRTNLRELPEFLPCPKDTSGKAIIAKTGMGSSAAMITSLVGALAQFFHVVSLPAYKKKQDVSSTNADLQFVHNLAQICHCVVQGKIGSGFDVSAAVFGTQQYKRFSPELLKPIVECREQVSPTDLSACVRSKTVTWDCEQIPFELPRGMKLLMGDVHGGSETVSMARKLLAWKRNHTATPPKLWLDLISSYDKLHEQLKQLSRAMDTETEENLQKLASVSGDKWENMSSSLASLLFAVRCSYLQTRGIIRAIGDEADVPIEPPQQTSLADATMNLPGVLMSGVPGAGGNDAIFALAIHECAVRGIEKCWETWHNPSDPNRRSLVCPLVLEAEPSGSHGGLCVETS